MAVRRIPATRPPPLDAWDAEAALPLDGDAPARRPPDFMESPPTIDGARLGVPAAAQPLPGEPELAATEEAVAAYVMDGMHAANTPRGPDGGIQYASNYARLYPDRFNPTWWRGHAAPDYFDPTGRPMTWELKPGKSASKALKAWLAGPTIAACRSTVVALYLDAIRAVLGDARFDEAFGSETGRPPAVTRLVISQEEGLTPLPAFLEQVAGSPRKGDWFYHFNHPLYPFKHPGGLWEGENALYEGEDEAGRSRWSGLGASKLTEDELLDEMVEAYNEPRTRRDEDELVYRNREDPIPQEYRPGSYPERITHRDIVEAPEQKVEGIRRRGGLDAQSGKRLSLQKLLAFRDR